MVKYLALCKYSPEATKGMLKETPSAREKVIRQTYESCGAHVISLDWLISGDYTVALTVEGPKDALVAMAATVAASGALTDVRVFELLSSAEMDQAMNKQINYRPPGA
jgi:uncharacterized protein with GYD domain